MDSTTRGLLLALAILIVAVLAFPMVMGGMMGPGMMRPGAMPGGGWGWGLGMGVGALAMLAFWGALIVGVVLLARGLSGGGRARWGLSATEILKPRYAKGEITRDEFEQMARISRTNPDEPHSSRPSGHPP